MAKGGNLGGKKRVRIITMAKKGEGNHDGKRAKRTTIVRRGRELLLLEKEDSHEGKMEKVTQMVKKEKVTTMVKRGRQLRW